MDSHKKGQSALEYLMTYGWALVVIVVVIAALVLLVGNPQSGDVCQTPGSGFSISNQDLNGNGVGGQGWKIKLSNITGRTMTITAANITPTGATIQTPPVTGIHTLQPGQPTELYFPATTTAGGKNTSTFTIPYSDPDSFARSVTFSCNGTG